MTARWNGFRRLARIEHGRSRLVSCNGNEFKSFVVLNEMLPFELRSESAILDAEIVCLDRDGKSQFRDPLFRPGARRFLAFVETKSPGEVMLTNHRTIASACQTFKRSG